MQLRPATKDDLPLLPKIALQAKSHWDYSEDFLEKCRIYFDASYTQEYLEKSHTFIVEENGRILGTGSLLWEEEPMIDQFWLLPDNIGKGFGRRVFDLLKAKATELGWPSLTIISDRYAEGFYEAMGAQRIGEVASEVQDAMLPKMRLDLS